MQGGGAGVLQTAVIAGIDKSGPDDRTRGGLLPFGTMTGHTHETRSGTYGIGQRVRVTQQVPHLGNGDPTMSTVIEGVVQRSEQQKTGSWFAHSKDHKLWLDRLVVKKDDGEVVYINLDQWSSVEVV